MLFRNREQNLFTILFTLIMGLVIYAPIQGQDVKKDTKNMNDEKTVMVTKEGIEYEIAGWDTRTVYDPHSYSFQHWETPIYETVEVKEIYPVKVSEFDKPPVFTQACADAADPIACTNEALTEFINNNPSPYPDKAQGNQQEGLEYVSFVLNENGEFEGRPSVLSKDKPCEGCAEEALTLIKQTEEEWQPAVLEGKKVKVKLTVPVRFRLEEQPFR